MKIVLIGFMGSGKSTVGNILSKKLNMDFVDTDNFIENRENEKIADIFKAKGEVYFRELETKALKEVCNTYENVIISVGGGLPMTEVNRPILKAECEVVYLKASIDTLYNRLKGDTKRPLLQGNQLREKIEELMKLRAKVYEEVAAYSLDTDGNTPEEIAQEIIKIIR